MRRRDRPFIGSVRVDLCATEPAIELRRVDDPVVVDHPQTVRVHIFDADGQHALGGGAQVRLVLDRPCIQPRNEGRDQRRELRALSRGPGLRRCWDAVRAHPSIGFQVGIAVELGSAATCLRIESQEQFGMRFHLRVAVRVEQARVIGRSDVRDPVLVPQNFSPLRRSRRRGARGRAADRGKAKRDDEPSAQKPAMPSRHNHHDVSPSSAISSHNGVGRPSSVDDRQSRR